jgi:hypothetical protein
MLNHGRLSRKNKNEDKCEKKKEKGFFCTNLATFCSFLSGLLVIYYDQK